MATDLGDKERKGENPRPMSINNNLENFGLNVRS